MPISLEQLAAHFPQRETGVSADGHPFVRVAPVDVPATLRALRDDLHCRLFIDLTAVDSPNRDERFELNYLVHSIHQGGWVRVKARTAGAAPTVTAIYAGANWYEREVFDLFGVRFEGHPSLKRIMLPDEWDGHPLRRDEPMGREPVDFTVTRDTYGT